VSILYEDSIAIQENSALRHWSGEPV
jgi:hypothetical protein